MHRFRVHLISILLGQYVAIVTRALCARNCGEIFCQRVLNPKILQKVLPRDIRRKMPHNGITLRKLSASKMAFCQNL